MDYNTPFSNQPYQPAPVNPYLPSNQMGIGGSYVPLANSPQRRFYQLAGMSGPQNTASTNHMDSFRQNLRQGVQRDMPVMSTQPGSGVQQGYQPQFNAVEQARMNPPAQAPVHGAALAGYMAR